MVGWQIPDIMISLEPEHLTSDGNVCIRVVDVWKEVRGDWQWERAGALEFFKEVVLSGEPNMVSMRRAANGGFWV